MYPELLTAPSISAHEYQGLDCNLFSSNTIYVDSSVVSGANNGSSWANAFLHFQDALFAAKYCNGIDTIKVAKGHLFPDVS